MVSAATQLSLRIPHFYGWFDPGYSPFEVLWWQDEDLCFTDLPSLKSIEIVVDLSAWMTAESGSNDSQDYIELDREYTKLYQKLRRVQGACREAEPWSDVHSQRNGYWNV